MYAERSWRETVKPSVRVKASRKILQASTIDPPVKLYSPRLQLFFFLRFRFLLQSWVRFLRIFFFQLHACETASF